MPKCDEIEQNLTVPTAPSITFLALTAPFLNVVANPKSIKYIEWESYLFPISILSGFMSLWT